MTLIERDAALAVHAFLLCFPERRKLHFPDEAERGESPFMQSCRSHFPCIFEERRSQMMTAFLFRNAEECQEDGRRIFEQMYDCHADRFSSFLRTHGAANSLFDRADD